MANTFEKVVKVSAHAKYGAFRGEDKSFYKPAGGGLQLQDFKVGEEYAVKGYSSESGKTHYITEIVNGEVKAEAKPSGRRFVKREEKAGDDKILVKPSGGRDFVKEAKGKTFSLIVAGLAHQFNGQDITENVILTTADRLLKGIEERGYF